MNENIFNWDEILHDPIFFGMGLGHIFVPKKKYKDNEILFLSHLYIHDEIKIGKSHPIMSH